MTVEYTLLTGGDTGQLEFVGVGGDIDGQINPTLTANPGDVVKITLINADRMLHDVIIDEFNAQSDQFSGRDEQDSITFTADQVGEFVYYCSVPGHRQAGMWGKLVVGQPSAPTVTGANIVQHPANGPAPVGEREPQTVQVDLVAEEVVGQLADNTSMTYFTFNGTVPGPMLRVRVGDTVEVHFRNDTTSQFPHSVDFHAATGPGGGAVYSNLNPGDETVFSFKALNPGLYVYHCATPSVAHHIANGMYGMILVEPEAGLAPVDREFYVMHGEIYTEEPFGTQGYVHFDHAKMLAEAPEYFVFNGAAGGLTTDDNALRANVGETVRLYFGVGGPNFTSSFHVIGEIMDRVYDRASLTSPPLTDVQTTLVPPGGATIVEVTLDVPGRFILVDHALSRLERGLVGYLLVDGDPDPTIFDGQLTAGSGH
ncbi:copper-containing nitrite reductase [Aggregatilinea lenta]|uniref:copper-containing nitrite reductase n=1 Tax=Aggregatilinea lenta TaxID=913108 RepID=UPI001EE99C90|nr:copper-containing nitrite reductase [Aggregatilinea lenta]